MSKLKKKLDYLKKDEIKKRWETIESRGGLSTKEKLDKLVKLSLKRKEKHKEVERTTSEVRDSFSKSQIPLEVVQGFMRLFTAGDFVKFARFRPHSKEAYQLVNEARTLVEVTTPDPEPEPLDEPPTDDMEPEVMA